MPRTSTKILIGCFLAGLLACVANGQLVIHLDRKPPQPVSATIGANGTTTIIVLNEYTTGTAEFSIAPSAGVVTLAYVSGEGTDELTYTNSRVVLAGETATWSYSSGDVRDLGGNFMLDFGGLTVVNNSEQETPPDTAPPTINNANIPSDGATIFVNASENIVGSEELGWTITASGGAVTVSSATGTGTAQLALTLSRTIDEGETVSLAYSSATGDLADESANDLATFSGLTVANGSDQGGDGTPILPQTTPSALPPTGWDGTADQTPANFTELQTAIDNPDFSGDGIYIIELDPAATYGPGLLQIQPVDAPGTGWVVIRTENFANLPDNPLVDGLPKHNRLQPSPANDADLATLIGRTGSPHECVWILPSTDGSGGASKVAFIGIEFKAADGHDPTTMVYVGSNGSGTSPTAASNFVDDVIAYQCRFNDNHETGGKVQFGYWATGNNLTASCCDFDLQGFTMNDGSIAVFLGGGTGHHIFNNRLQAEGVGLFAGTNNVPSHGVLSTDVTIDHNYSTRPMEWDDGGDYHKNCLEIKGGERYLIERNRLENSWKGAGGQLGQAIVIKNTQDYTRDVTVRYNKANNTWGAIHVQARDFPGDGTTAQQMQRITIHDNLFYDIDINLGTTTNKAAGHIAQVTADVAHLRVLRNTFVVPLGRGNILLHVPPTASGLVCTDLIWRDNAHAVSTIAGVFRKDSTDTNGISVLNEYWEGWSLDHNALVGMNAGTLDESGSIEGGATCDDNYFPTVVADLNFTDAGSDNYRIETGTYSTASSTAGPVGADIDEVESQTADVETGAPP